MDAPLSDGNAEAIDALQRLDDPPTAFVTGNNRRSARLLRHLKERGTRPLPAVVGFDDSSSATLLDRQQYGPGAGPDETRFTAGRSPTTRRLTGWVRTADGPTGRPAEQPTGRPPAGQDRVAAEASSSPDPGWPGSGASHEGTAGSASGWPRSGHHEVTPARLRSGDRSRRGSMPRGARRIAERWPAHRCR